MTLFVCFLLKLETTSSKIRIIICWREQEGYVGSIGDSWK